MNRSSSKNWINHLNNVYNILFQFQVELSHLEDGGEKKGCFKCGGDHMAKDCEQPDKCQKCGEEGHMLKDCETEPKTHIVQNEDGTTQEIYVPTEITDDDVFKFGITSGINFDRPIDGSKVETKRATSRDEKVSLSVLFDMSFYC